MNSPTLWARCGCRPRREGSATRRLLLIWSGSVAAHRVRWPGARADRRVGCAHALFLGSRPALGQSGSVGEPKDRVERPRLSPTAHSLAMLAEPLQLHSRVDRQTRQSNDQLAVLSRRLAASLLRRGRRDGSRWRWTCFASHCYVCRLAFHLHAQRRSCSWTLTRASMCAHRALRDTILGARGWGSTVSEEGTVPALIIFLYGSGSTAHAAPVHRTNSREIRTLAARGRVRPSSKLSRLQRPGIRA